jgi:hypothetical protein
MKTWVFAILPPIEVLAKMAYGSGMKDQAIGSRRNENLARSAFSCYHEAVYCTGVH